jgi:UDP-N-acetylglucosamine:LPS N-acetylglucosamine transferase
MRQHLAPNGLQHLMSTTNYAVTVYGVSFFELLQLGVPTVVFSPYGEKDDQELKEIEQEGLALVAKDEKDATQKLIALMKNEELAARLSATATERLRSRGIDRLCSEVKMLLST